MDTTANETGLRLPEISKYAPIEQKIGQEFNKSVIIYVNTD